MNGCGNARDKNWVQFGQLNSPIEISMEIPYRFVRMNKKGSRNLTSFAKLFPIEQITVP